MKPTDKFIEWLHAHPAVWEALQEEWEPAVCDWCMAGENVAAEGLGYVARWQTPDDDGSHHTTWVVVVTPDSGMGYIGGGSQELIRQGFLWFPTLGQLVRLLDDAGHEEFWAHFHMQGRTVVWLPSGDNDEWDGDLTKPPEAPPQGMEPEIACTALWAKVKGIDV